MKLRTKVILSSMFTLLFALAVAIIIVCLLLWDSYKNEAIGKSYQRAHGMLEEYNELLNTTNLITPLEEGTENSNASFSSTVSILKSENDYFFNTFEFPLDDKRNKIGYISLLKSNNSNEPEVELYNNTVLDSKFVRSLKYEFYIGDLIYTTFKYDGNEYVVFSATNNVAFDSQNTIYQIENISYIWSRLAKLLALLVCSSIVIAIITLLVLILLLRKIFHPLQELNESAKNIANNVYDQRVHITTKDEIGELGENFNKMAEAIERYTKSLEESEKKKTMFMGNLTHELKTPMTAMCGYSQLLLTAKLSEKDREEALMYINEECNRLERLSKKMMCLMGLDKEENLEMQKVRIQEIFENAAKSCSILAREKDITLQINPSEMIIQADKDLMVDVFVNLIDNAIKASPNGGKIQLYASKDGIIVEDFGCGIPKEEQDRIVEPFYMIDKSRSRKNGGAGLGLALTTMILKKHNMKLSIDSEIGRGTKVILQFV